MTMRRRSGWSDKDQEEYERMLWAAHTSAPNQTKRIDRYVNDLTAKIADEVKWAEALQGEALRDLGQKELATYAQSQKPKVAVDYNGKPMKRPAAGGVRRRSKATGKAHPEQTLFTLMAWDELRDKQLSIQATRRSLGAEDARIVALLRLEAEVPEATTPAEALEVLGLTEQEWLDGASA